MHLRNQWVIAQAGQLRLVIGLGDRDPQARRFHTALTGEGPTWELGEAARAETETGVLFHNYGFADGYAEADLG